MTDVNAKVLERKSAIEKEFKELEARVNLLNSQGAEINRQLSLTKSRQIQLQGAYAEVKNLLAEDKPATPAEETPK